MYETLLTSVDAGVARITLNRPQARNALSRTLVRELAEALAHFEADAAARVIVLSGAGERAFCAGADLKGMGDRGTTLQARESFSGLPRSRSASCPSSSWRPSCARWGASVGSS
jgi:enoyl-CoA hydratase/carnithine racemase